MFRRICQRLLHDAIQGGFDLQRQTIRRQAARLDIHSNAMRGRIIIGIALQGGDEAQIVQHTGPQSPREAPDLIERGRGDPSEGFRLRLGLLHGAGVFDQAQANEKRREGLSGLIVQLAGNSSTLFFLGRDHLLRHRSEPLFAFPERRFGGRGARAFFLSLQPFPPQAAGGPEQKSERRHHHGGAGEAHLPKHDPNRGQNVGSIHPHEDAPVQAGKPFVPFCLGISGDDWDMSPRMCFLDIAGLRRGG